MIKLTRRSALYLALATSTCMATSAIAQEQDRILLLINGTLGDKSFFDSAANGMAMIEEKYGDQVETQILEVGPDPTRWEPALLDASEQDWSLIIAGTYSMGEVLGEVAQQYPDQNYILFDAAVPYDEGGFENVYSIQFRQNEGSYLAGVLAAGLLASGTIEEADGNQLGFLGGMDIPVINDFMVGYVAGAQSVLPDVNVQVAYIGSFSDAAKGKELGLSQFNSDVAVGFSAASQAGLGQLSAANETGRYAIGVDSDQEALFAENDPEISSRVVSSVLKNVDVSLLLAYDTYVAGDLPFGSVAVLGLEQGAVGLVEDGNMATVAPSEVLTMIDDAKTAIANGEVTVPTAFGMSTEEVSAIREAVRP